VAGWPRRRRPASPASASPSSDPVGQPSRVRFQRERVLLGAAAQLFRTGGEPAQPAAHRVGRNAQACPDVPVAPRTGCRLVSMVAMSMARRGPGGKQHVRGPAVPAAASADPGALQALDPPPPGRACLTGEGIPGRTRTGRPARPRPGRWSGVSHLGHSSVGISLVTTRQPARPGQVPPRDRSCWSMLDRGSGASRGRKIPWI
jgi:hypothetical protein